MQLPNKWLKGPGRSLKRKKKRKSQKFHQTKSPLENNSLVTLPKKLQRKLKRKRKKLKSRPLQKKQKEELLKTLRDGEDTGLGNNISTLKMNQLGKRLQIDFSM